MLQILFDNIGHNLFKPLLLFFYAGFLIPVLGIAFDFPQVIYQGLTIYLLLAIGWRGGEELAALPPDMINQAGGFIVLGFVTNFVVGVAAYFLLRSTTGLRKIDAAAVSGHYGSDSAGTFVTCVGVLTAGQVAFASYMPVMLAVMEIPGCLVALLLVSHLRRRGMDAAGNMPGEIGYAGLERPRLAKAVQRKLRRRVRVADLESRQAASAADAELELVAVAAGAESEAGDAHHNGHASHGSSDARRFRNHRANRLASEGGVDFLPEEHEAAAEVDLEEVVDDDKSRGSRSPKLQVGKLLHEVFLNPGTFLLFAGLAIGFISRRQGEEIVAKNDTLFVSLFQGMLCLFLLEMGMTASKRLKDLKSVGWRFVAFGVIAPNLFAMLGIALAHLYAMSFGYHFALGTYVLFAALCASASYIAVPAIQRLAIPEASPTLPLAASLGLTFSYNVTVGIPVYLMLANALMTRFPVAT